MNVKSKSSLICFILMVVTSTAYSQFTHDPHQGAKWSGNVDTVVYENFAVYPEDTLSRHLTSKSILVYNQKGQQIAWDEYSYRVNPDIGVADTMPVRTHFLYDQKGNLTQVYSKWQKTDYGYSSSGAMVYIKYFHADSLNGVDTISFDKTGRIIQSRGGAPRSLSVTGSYIYDDRGFLKEHKILYKNDTLSYLYQYDYDGNLTEEQFISNGKTFITTYTYNKFDAHNNWLVKYAYNNGKLRYITRRNLAYRK